MSSLKFTTVPSKRLNATISSSALSFQLSDIKGWNGSDLTSTDFGTKAYGIFRNSGNTLMEIFEWDPTTVANSSITILLRGLKFDGTLDTEVTANKLTWVKGDTVVELGSDVPQLLNHTVRTVGSPTIDELIGYTTELTPLDNKDLATKKYVDDTATGGTVSNNRIVVAGDAGETVAAGNLVYYDTVTNNEWMLCDADTAASVDNVLLGIAQGAGTNGNTITGGVLLVGLDSNQSGMTIGNLMYASNTAGTISSTVGTTEVTVGIAATATTLYFNPRVDQQITENQKDALVGAQGTPSSTNTFLTEDYSTTNSSSGTTDQSQAIQNSSTQVGEADATGKKNSLAQSFISTKTKIRGVKLYKSADTGTFTGTVSVALQADSSGEPDGTDLATVTFTNSEWLSKTVAEFDAIFSTEYGSVVVGDLYWIVITTSTSDNANHPNIGDNSAGGYTDGSVMYNNTTDGWTAISTIDLYFKTIEGIISQSLVTNISGKIDSVFYDVTELPKNAFQQKLNIVGKSMYLNSYELGSGSNQDGSVLYVFNDYNTSYKLQRFERDANTGMYELTHYVNPSFSSGSLDNVAIIVIGNYVYLFSNDGTNIKSSRFLASDLSGETVMSVPTVSSTGVVIAWTDGTNAYIVSVNSSTTSRKWAVSGTSFSAESTSTCQATLINDYGYSISDGKNVYIVGISLAGKTLEIHKLNDIFGATITTTTKKITAPIDSTNSFPGSGGGVGASIDENRMYYGYIYATFDETDINGNFVILNPITKP